MTELRHPALIGLSLVLVLVSGCMSTGGSDVDRTRQEGVAIGAAIGAIAGYFIGEEEGAWIGALAGGLGGAVLAELVVAEKQEAIDNEEQLQAAIDRTRETNTRLHEYNYRLHNELTVLRERAARLSAQATHSSHAYVQLQRDQQKQQKLLKEADLYIERLDRNIRIKRQQIDEMRRDRHISIEMISHLEEQVQQLELHLETLRDTRALASR